ncbi:hypothetical protein PIB30_093481, partial [Stylosanthes scabra]|nr:hypothetical protein [Stylosanthes scabra]
IQSCLRTSNHLSLVYAAFIQPLTWPHPQPLPVFLMTTALRKCSTKHFSNHMCGGRRWDSTSIKMSIH